MTKINKSHYVLVLPEKDKMLRIKGHKQLYSVGTEKIGKPKEWEEI